MVQVCPFVGRRWPYRPLHLARSDICLEVGRRVAADLSHAVGCCLGQGGSIARDLRDLRGLGIISYDLEEGRIISARP